MISLSANATSLLTGSYTYLINVQSWLGDQLLSDDIPISSASEETDRSLNVPERVIFTVPRLEGGMSWSPVAADHPLAANGQRLRVQLGIGDASSGEPEWLQRGWFVVQDTQIDGDQVSVTAAGLLTLIQEARLISPFQPSGTLVSTLRGLIEPALTVLVDANLADRSVPAGINYDDDRLGAVAELVDAWPADMSVNPDGYLDVGPATQSTTPVLALTNGTGGTIIKAAGASTRDGGFNAVVARGTATDGGQVQGVAYLGTGPKMYGGPFNPLPVPYFFSSPLLTTAAQCAQSAATVLARLQRQAGLQFQVDMVPNPAVQAGDVLTITTDDYTDLLVSVEALRLPYTADGGSQSLTVRTVN